MLKNECSKLKIRLKLALNQRHKIDTKPMVASYALSKDVVRHITTNTDYVLVR